MTESDRDTWAAAEARRPHTIGYGAEHAEPPEWQIDPEGEPAPPGAPRMNSYGGDEVAPEVRRADELRMQLLSAAQLATLPAPDSLVEGILDTDSLAWLYGAPGSGKSFIANHLAGCVGSGLPWLDRPVKAGPVLYVLAEGAPGFAPRVSAWQHAHGPMDNVTFLPVAVQLLTQVDLGALLAILRELRPVLVVLDTQARVSVGANESDTGDMGRLVAAVDRIRVAAGGAAVVLVHHEPRNGDNPRGSTVLEGAATTIIRVTKDGPLMTLSCRKQKDGEPFNPLLLYLSASHGSAVVTTSHEGVGVSLLATSSELRLVEVMRESFGSTGASSSVLLKASGVPDSTFYRALQTLVRKGILINAGSVTRTRYVLTETTPTLDLPLLPPTSHESP